MTDAERERAAVVAWLRKDVAAEATRMILAAGMPGGTATERVKRRAFAAGVAHATQSIFEGLEQGAHLKEDRP